jgi:hypothetical protein
LISLPHRREGLWADSVHRGCYMDKIKVFCYRKGVNGESKVLRKKMGCSENCVAK